MSGNRWDGANCLDVDPEVMQPERATKGEVAAAKQVCAGCPLVAQCLELARSQRSLEGRPTAYGVHAGLWFGEEPTWEAVYACSGPGCGVEYRTKPRSSGGSSYCSTRCRVRAHRANAVSA